MTELTYHRRTLVAAAHPNIIRVNNLPRCKLRIINMNNNTDAALMSCAIILKNAPAATAESISIFQTQQSLGAGRDVGWEGEIELGAYQDLQCTFEDTPGVAPTAGDILVVTIGYERLDTPNRG